MTEFSLEVFQNEYVARGTTTMDAIVTITARGGRPVLAGEAAEVLIVDTSGSMGEATGRIEAVRQAAAEAVDGIRDGVLFAVIAGTDRAAMVFPAWGTGLVVADAASRRAAREAVRHLQAGGGTAMSTWLLAARDLFVSSPASLRHVILLTDGENWENPGMLEATLERCRGLFQADCRGVGTDWVVHQLRTIASELLGTVDIIPEPSLMAAEFRRLMETAMGRAVASASLRVWCPQAADVNFVRQVAPEVEDLTAKATSVDARTRQYPLGAWGVEARDYHVSLAVPANDVGVEMLAARVHVATDDDTVGPALVRAIWTDDDAASARINREVAHYTGQAELSAAIQDGLEALKQGDEREATVKLGRATQLAVDSGHEGTVRLLRKVVEVDDERAGTVRIRKHVAKVDEMALDTRSTRTVRVGKGGGSAAPTHSFATPAFAGAAGAADAAPGFAAALAPGVPAGAGEAWMPGAAAGTPPVPAAAAYQPAPGAGWSRGGSTPDPAVPDRPAAAAATGWPAANPATGSAPGGGWGTTDDAAPASGPTPNPWTAGTPDPGAPAASPATAWTATPAPGAAPAAAWSPTADPAAPAASPGAHGGTTDGASWAPGPGTAAGPGPWGGASHLAPAAAAAPSRADQTQDGREAQEDDEMALDTRSTVTTRVRRQQPDRSTPDDADLDTRSTRTVRTVRRGTPNPTDDDGAGDA